MIMNNIKLKEMLADLGRYINQADNNYATKVRDVIMPSTPDGSKLSVGRGLVGYGAGFPAFQGPADIIDEMTGLPRAAANINERLMSYAPIATGVTARYIVPGAGMTMAGQALANLILSNEDQPQVM